MPPATVITVAGAFLAAVGALIAFYAVRPPAPTQADQVVERLDAYERTPEVLLNLDDQEARLGFRDRVVQPMLRRFAAGMARRTPDAARIDLQRKLNMAGRPLGLSASEFLVVRYVTAGMGGLGGGLLGLLTAKAPLIFLGLAIGAITGLFIPRSLISSRVKKARKELQGSLPDAMDLMSVCVEAGMTFEGAMSRVAERYSNALGAEFAQVLREIQLGRSRRDAMSELGDRSGVDEVHSFAQAVVQSDTLGTGIARILRIQSDELRRRRRQRAQEQGAKATLKMLFPMILFIFPSIWIVLLGPAVLLVMSELIHK
jgi:tight adherence protein C